MFGSDDDGVTWFPDGPAAGGTTNGPGFGHTATRDTLYFGQDKILRWNSQNVWDIVAHPSGQEGWKYTDTVNSYCWSVAADGALLSAARYGQCDATSTRPLEETPGPPKGVRIYGVAVLPSIQKLLVVVRDGSVWLTSQPVVVNGFPRPPGPVRVVPG